MMRASAATRTIASALAGGFTLGAPASAAAQDHGAKAKPAHVRAASSQPARLTVLKGGLDEGLVFKLTQRGRFDRVYAEACEERRCDPFLLKGLHQWESGEIPKALNEDTGAKGISQMTPGGARAVTNLQRRRGVRRPFTYADAFDPVKSIHAAAELLEHLVDYCRVTVSNFEVLLAAYNTGSCRAKVPGFVLGVVGKANKIRQAVGLPEMPAPRFWWKVKKPRRVPRASLPNS